MPAVFSRCDLERSVREYASRLGIRDDQAIAAALHQGCRSRRTAYARACGYLRSWQRHPSNRRR